MNARPKVETARKGPFDSLEQAAYLSMQRTANLLVQGFTELLRPRGLTATQYNVLRILRGAASPLTCSEVGGRMIAHDPDVTRLLDRLEKQGLVRRERSSEDRRVVVTEITAEGKRLTDDLDEPVARLHQEQLGHMGDGKLRTLVSLLSEAREQLAS
ncbi:MAG: MarR family transcriptional regulator [Gemmatimonadota bacterium]|jgi:DNA-binding MarR family transcriptional regulator